MTPISKIGTGNREPAQLQVTDGIVEEVRDFPAIGSAGDGDDDMAEKFLGLALAS